MSDDSRLILGPGDEPLQSGMKAGEAVKRAAAWWDKEARHQLRKASNRERVGRKFVAAGKAQSAAAILIQGDDVDVIPSNLLRGLPWDQLNRREKLQVVKQWHAYFVLRPQASAIRH